jgi:hypothetical protein
MRYQSGQPEGVLRLRQTSICLETAHHPISIRIRQEVMAYLEQDRRGAVVSCLQTRPPGLRALRLLESTSGYVRR